jgi:transposase
VSAQPDLKVYDLGHLGLVTSVLGRIQLVKTVDRLVGPRPEEKVSTGMALKAAILNALGFVASPLYLFGHYGQGKPTEWLLGKGITPELLNDDRMGRMLDTLHAAGVTEVFLEVAREARKAFPFPVRALHADATSFHVHGQYEGLREEVGAIRITHGYRRDHRPDFKPWVMNLVCADTGGIPLCFAPGNGNQSDQGALVPLLAHYRQALDLGEVEVRDGAGYSRENLRTLEGFSWILRVPATLKEARALLEGEFPREAWTPLLPGYRGLEVECGYGGVRQRWLLVESEARAREEEEGLRGRVARAEGEAAKMLGRLLSRKFACEADARRALEEVKSRFLWVSLLRPRAGSYPCTA